MRSKPKQSAYEKALVRLSDQRKWIESCGGDLSGYIANYGDPGVPCANGKPMFGDGGTLIYAADVGRLRQIEAEVHSFRIRGHGRGLV